MIHISVYYFYASLFFFVVTTGLCTPNLEFHDPASLCRTKSLSHHLESLQKSVNTGVLGTTSGFIQPLEVYTGTISIAKKPEPAKSDQPEINQLKIAGMEFPVFFESANIPISLKTIIISDIELNLSHFKHILFSPIESEDMKQLFHAPVTHVLDIGHEERLYPEVFKKYFGGAILSGNTYQIVIHEKLINAYEQAVEYKKTHPDMFQKLSLFLEQLKDKDFIAQIEGNRNLAKRFIVFEACPPSSYDYERELSGLLKYGNIRKPSLLDFNNVTYNGKDVVRFSTVIGWQESMSAEPFTKGFPQFIFLDEEWRVYVPHMP